MTRTRGERRYFRVECEPHVRIRLKNWFGGVAKARSAAILISPTDENCRELAWFLSRYPMEMADATRRAIEEGSVRQVERVDSVTKILDGDFQLPLIEPAIPFRPYQEQAAAALFNTGSLLLTDEFGLGKTGSAIRVMFDERALPALAVVPAPLTEQWAEEIRKFAPGLRTHILRSSSPYDLADEDGSEPHVIITSYHKLAAWADHLVGKVRYVVFDECQELRTGTRGPNPSKKNLAAEIVASEATYRGGLTATPVYNYGGEIFNIIDVLTPGFLGSAEEFEREWCYDTGRHAAVTDPRAFAQHLIRSGMMMRRTRDDVGEHLPALSVMVHEVPSGTDNAFTDVESAAAEMARLVLDSSKAAFERGRAGRHLDTLLRQATGIAKAPGVAALVRLVASEGEKVVLFGWHRAVYDLWAELLEDLEPAWYTGTESVKKKREGVKRFVDGDCQLLIMSLRSGLGLNRLQEVCATAVHGELDWSPGVHEQCNCRLHRPGQKRPVFAHYAITDSGSDPVVSDVLGIKRGQVEGIRDPDGAKVVENKLDPEHIKRLARDYLARFKQK